MTEWDNRSWYGADGLVSQWDTVINSPSVRTITSRYMMLLGQIQCALLVPDVPDNIRTSRFLTELVLVSTRGLGIALACTRGIPVVLVPNSPCLSLCQRPPNPRWLPITLFMLSANIADSRLLRSLTAFRALIKDMHTTTDYSPEKFVFLVVVLCHSNSISVISCR